VDRKQIFAATPEEHELVTKLYGSDPAETSGDSCADDAYDLSSVPDVEDLALLSGGFDEASARAVTLVRKMH
jgi:hypothetical protein